MLNEFNFDEPFMDAPQMLNPWDIAAPAQSPAYGYPQQPGSWAPPANAWQAKPRQQYYPQQQYPPQRQYAPPPQPAWEPAPAQSQPSGALNPFDISAFYDQEQPQVSAAMTLAEKPTTPLRKALKAVSNVVFWAVCLAIVAGSALFALSKDPGKSYLGFRLYSVKTASMTPQADSLPGGFNAGAVILVKMSNPGEIKAGDIITFNPGVMGEDAAVLTHRVVRVLDELGGKPGTYFVTKGDANKSEDPPISGDMLIGKKVAHIPRVGTFLQGMRENFVVYLVTVLCFFAFLFVLRWFFAKPKQPQPEKKARQGGRQAEYSFSPPQQQFGIGFRPESGGLYK